MGQDELGKILIADNDEEVLLHQLPGFLKLQHPLDVKHLIVLLQIQRENQDPLVLARGPLDRALDTPPWVDPEQTAGIEFIRQSHHGR